MADKDRSTLMDKIVALCKRRGFIFQDSEIYGGQNGFWDYGPLGTELKRNVRNAWWEDMVGRHDPLDPLPGAPSAYQMVGVETSIIMHPQVWKVSGHYDLFCDKMVDCKESKGRYRLDHTKGRWVEGKIADKSTDTVGPVKAYFVTALVEESVLDETLTKKALTLFGMKNKEADKLQWKTEAVSLATIPVNQYVDVVAPDATKPGTFTEPRDFNLMMKTIIGALGTEDNAAFLRPETAQGIFVNFKNVMDSTRVKLPVGICQIGKSFRNEITPRNFTFRSREFEQMEIEFFCKPDESPAWYQYWRDRRFAWYTSLGIGPKHLRLRDHDKDELSHYSCGTADIEYQFPFLADGEYGELEGVAHRGDFDLRSHMEGKLKNENGQLVVEKGPDGQPKWRGSGKDLTYFDDQTRERFLPHVIEPSAGADRGTLAFICEAYHEDEAPDDKGQMQTRVVMKFHPRLAPIKAAVFPLVKKDGQPEKAKEIYRALMAAGIAVTYDEQAAIGKRYRRQDEIGTPWCITVDNDTLSGDTVTLRDRDTLEQIRLPVSEVVREIASRLRKS
ncbi:glycine--tRNA ligase [Planctomicrobium piriforme]|uniref:Glycine--tRNA ligase n=1 Tax=Planctomicrobium piriforme TaxID=1576369 RepID=A0A1I3MJR7_9PLAN|nr:glycine--tRNA ligase [Planctomicrobium piriforme]SFI97223.1 glycyl-tRNA synthetase [Planctomicrobium piriforme]